MAISLIGSDVANCYTGMLALVGIASSFRDVARSVLVRVAGPSLLVAAGTLCALLGYQQFVDEPRQLPQRAAARVHPVERHQPDRLLPRAARRVRRPVVLHAARPLRRVPWRGLFAYLIAVALEVPFIDQTFYTGPLVEPLGGVDISWLVGGVAGVVVLPRRTAGSRWQGRLTVR